MKPITPKTFEKNLQAIKQASIDFWTESINRSLMQGIPYGKITVENISVDGNHVRVMSGTDVVQGVIDNFREAGWKIKFSQSSLDSSRNMDHRAGEMKFNLIPYTPDKCE